MVEGVLCCFVRRTCVSARAWSTSVFASAVNPDMAQPMWSSISMIFCTLLGSCSRCVKSVACRAQCAMHSSPAAAM
jgi:hypothetical protein